MVWWVQEPWCVSVMRWSSGDVVGRGRSESGEWWLGDAERRVTAAAGMRSGELMVLTVEEEQEEGKGERASGEIGECYHHERWRYEE